MSGEQQVSIPANPQLQAAPPNLPASGPSTQGDPLQCMWAGCSDRATSAEQLYEHVCERHVGRKSTNNLNLTCQWGNCHTTTVKRDHITSHIRVHVPLKPHKCDFCGKSFKRPQDLKKHVKTHADESVIIRSPEPPSGTRHPPNGGYGNINNQPRPQTGYYPEPQLQSNVPMNYGFQGHTTNGNSQQGYYAPTAQTTSQSFGGSVYYSVNNGDAGNQASYGDRKRGTEAVDNLFGSIKRHEFDPHSYSEIANRLVPFHGVQLPLLSAGAGMSDYQTGPGVMSAHGPSAMYTPSASHGYTLPMPQLRTKQDLVDADQYLAQMVATAYENGAQAGAAGLARTGAHHVQSGLTLRTSNSPPGMQMDSAHNHSHSSHVSTPELTPGSSHYSDRHSPIPHISPIEQQSTSQTMYPTLPSVTSSMPGQAPSSTLGGQYDNELRRRYSGGHLQKAAPGGVKREEDMDIEDRLPSTLRADPSHRKQRSLAKNMIDPALSGDVPSNTSSPTPPAAATVDEEWVENMRLLETLRDCVRAKLDRGEYEDDEPSMEAQLQKSLYPVLKD